MERIFLAGCSGLVGQAFVRKLESSPSTQLICRSRTELDLTRQESVVKLFEEESPNRVILAAGTVGGIQANIDFPGKMIYENILIAANVIHGAFCSGTAELLYFGSSCMYPKYCKQPMRESDLLGGFLESSNDAYAMAKLAGWKLVESYNREYGTRYRTLIPGNLYGPCDRFSVKDSHVIPALLRKFHEAKKRREQEVVIWGSGEARREFLYIDDLIDACLFLEEFPDLTGPVNVGANSSISIRELTNQIREVVDFHGEIKFDQSKPDGAPARKLETSILDDLGWQTSTSLREGLRKTYDWFVEHELSEKE